MATDAFFQEYTSQDAILKYSRTTAGFGISHLLDHDYKAVYLEALGRLPVEVRQRGIRMLEFGCGAGMNLLHLVSVLRREGMQVERAVGTDFSPVLIEAAQREEKNYLPADERRNIGFCVAKNETLIDDLSSALGTRRSELESSFDFILGVNTIRYCHRAGKQLDCARDIFNLLAPGGVCVVIDMNDRFPAFRSAALGAPR
jgi:SAM-dependent methyltransferase